MVGAGREGTAFEICGALVRTYRERSGLSQEELAERAGVSDRTIRNLESGTRRPRRDTIDRLVSVLGLDGDERDGLIEAWTGGHRPCSLPADLPDFVGRDSTLQLAAEALRTGTAGPSRVCVLAGMGGTGKTTLAVHLAHALAGRYPDGQLYLDLRGSQARPVEPVDALGRLLGRLGLAGAHLPSDVDERAEILRDRLAGRRMLLVLDDVAAEPQVRALLPGTAGAAAVLTSRNRLSGLAGAVLLEVGVFGEEEALALLTAVIGPERVAAERAAAEKVVQLCGHLPLAVRVVAALLAGRPSWRVGHVAGLLADERQRLSVLEAGDLCVPASISLSYQALPAPARRAFRLLSTLDAAHFAAWTAAAVLDVPVDIAQRVLERLVDAYLLEIVGTDEAGQLRYRYHDLVGLYARHHGDGAPDETTARLIVERAARATLTLVEQAGGDQLAITLPTPARTADRWPASETVLAGVAADPLAWLDAEHTSTVATVRQAAGAGQLEVAADLATAVADHCSLRCEFSGWYSMMDALASAAREAGDPAIEATANLALADVLAERGDLTAARKLVESTLPVAAQHGMRRLEARALVTLGIIDRSTFATGEAAASLRRAIHSAEAAGDRLARAYALSELGSIHVGDGDLDAAERCYLTAYSLLRELADPRGETKLLIRLAILQQSRGDLTSAGQGFRRALAAAERHGDRRAANEIRYRLGRLCLLTGAPEDAAGLLERAATDSRAMGDERGTAFASDALGDTYARLGDTPAARQALRVALAYYERLQDARQEGIRERLAALN